MLTTILMLMMRLMTTLSQVNYHKTSQLRDDVLDFKRKNKSKI